MSSEWTLSTLKELLETRLTAQEKAVEKADVALKEYKLQANEFRGTLKDQSAEFLRTSEANSQFKQFRDLIEAQQRQIVALQLANSRGEGGTSANSTSKANSQWLIALVVMIALSMAGGIGTLIFFLATKH
jgi:hypothetical protein